LHLNNRASAGLAQKVRHVRMRIVSSSTLSTKGQIVIPARIRKALDLRAGDKVEMKLEGRKLVLQRGSPRGATLKRGRFGRPVLATANGAPPMTTESVNALLEELP
jgi:AbrB family looped-hinge helix DNA binding protein